MCGNGRAAPISAYPGYQPADGGARRIQRQVHVQPVCPARRIVRDAAVAYPPDLSQLSFRPMPAGSSPGSGSRGTHESVPHQPLTTARLRRRGSADFRAAVRRGLARSRTKRCRANIFTTSAAPNCSTASASSPSTTPRARRLAITRRHAATWPSDRRRRPARRIRQRQQHQDRGFCSTAFRCRPLCPQSTSPANICCESAGGCASDIRRSPCGRSARITRPSFDTAARRFSARADARLISRARPSAISSPTTPGVFSNTCANMRAGSGLLIGVDLKKDIPPDSTPPTTTPRESRRNSISIYWPASIANSPATSISTAFAHYAAYNVDLGRVEMRLVSLAADRAGRGGARFGFDEGEGIFTESCYKYTLDGFEALAAAAGYRVHCVWLDDDRLFSVQYLAAVCNPRSGVPQVAVLRDLCRAEQHRSRSTATCGTRRNSLISRYKMSKKSSPAGRPAW